MRSITLAKVISATVITFSISLSTLAAGELLINSTAGKTYAGFGYTHGYIPVTEGSGGYSIFDNDIMRYDMNNSKPAENYFNQEDNKRYYGNQNTPVESYTDYIQ